jgi:hypothetical protein
MFLSLGSRVLLDFFWTPILDRDVCPMTDQLLSHCPVRTGPAREIPLPYVPSGLVAIQTASFRPLNRWNRQCLYAVARLL